MSLEGFEKRTELTYCTYLDDDTTNFNSDLKFELTQSKFGYTVLNTYHIFIADVDIDPASNIPQLRSKEAYLQYMLRLTNKDYNDWHNDNQYRVYETHSGFRIFITNKFYNSESEESDNELYTLLADPLYRVCCNSQKCYRARLTPKPARVDAMTLCDWLRRDWVMMFETGLLERWNSYYYGKAKEHNTCAKPLFFPSNSDGSPAISENTEILRTIMRIHDDYTLSKSDTVDHDSLR